MAKNSLIGCLACDLLSGVQALPGGRLHETPHWVVEHTIGPLGLGTLIVKPIRHVVHVAEMNEAESSELGPLLRQTAAAVTEVVEPEQIYTCLWSHAGGVPVHIHFVVQPITRAVMTRFNALGPDLQTAMFRDGTLPGADDIDAICHRFRGIFRRDDETVDGSFR